MSALRHRAVGLAAALLLAGPVHSAPLSFDFEDGDGEIFTSKTEQGVDFLVSGGSAAYGTGIYTGLDGFVLIGGKVLELDEGATLTISFPEVVFSSVSGIELDVWLPGDLNLALVPAVQLFDGNGDELTWDDPAFGPNPEQHYAWAYSGSAVARSITIRFDEGFSLPAAFSLVALDNLQADVELVPAPEPIPEPSTYLLTAAGLLLLGTLAKSRRRA
jgi:hypothetical protein